MLRSNAAKVMALALPMLYGWTAPRANAQLQFAITGQTAPAAPHTNGWTNIGRWAEAQTIPPVVGTALENQGTITFTGSIVGQGSPPPTSSYDVTTVNGTAIAGTDYESFTGTVTCQYFSCSSFTITILDDGGGDEADPPVNFVLQQYNCVNLCCSCANEEFSVLIDEVPQILVTTPDIKALQILEPLPLATCLPQLASIITGPIATAGYRVVGACVAQTYESNNPAPPDTAPAEWAAFKQDKSQKGFLHIPPINLACDDKGNALAFAQVGDEESSYGYTELGVPVPGAPGVPVDGDVWMGEGFTNGETFTPGASSVSAFDKRASRIAFPAIPFFWGVMGYVPSFLYLNVTDTINCAGTFDLTVERATYPTTYLYVNDQFAILVDQQNLPQFIQKGGTGLPVAHQGSLAPAGQTIQCSQNTGQSLICSLQ